MNRICLVGRITRDLELKKTPQGLAVCNFSIAVRKISKDPANNVDFFDCVVFGVQAENLVRFQRKGSLISVEGLMDTRTYQAKDGSNRKAYEVITDRINFLGSAQDNNQQQSFAQAPESQEDVVDDSLSVSNDNLPF